MNMEGLSLSLTNKDDFQVANLKLLVILGITIFLFGGGGQEKTWLADTPRAPPVYSW